MYSRSSTIKIGENRGIPRIWLEGKWLDKAGFKPGKKIHIDIHTNKITIIQNETGDHIVSGKKKNTIPVIDINCKELNNAFNTDIVQISAGNNQITVTPAHTAVLMSGRKLLSTEASMFSGGGLLSLAAKMAGFEPKVAIEINPVYANIFEHNHPSARMFNMSASEVSAEELKKYAPIGIFTAGIPCEPYSKIRRLNRGGQDKRNKTLPPEAHELGDMVFWCMRNIEILNPHTVIIEEVPEFLNSGASHILLNVLKRLYKYVDSKIMNAIDYGSLTGRKRAVIIAQDKSIKWPAMVNNSQKLGNIFDQSPHEWFDRNNKTWLFNHWDRQTAKGNGFASQIYTADSTKCGTIKKRYFAQQGDNPVIAHPNKKGVYRWLTLNEVKKLHGLPEDYYLGESKTSAGEIIGQGVCVDMFHKIIESVIN